MFFGLVGVLYALFAGSAKVRMVEQPVTILNRYFTWPTHRLRTSAFGDTMDKTICLRLVGLSLSGLANFHRDPIDAVASGMKETLRTTVPCTYDRGCPWHGGDILLAVVTTLCV